VLEPVKNGAILQELFDRAWKSVQKLPKEQRHLLEDRFIMDVRLAKDKDDKRTLEWIEKLERNEKDRMRVLRWKEERLLFYLYDLGNIEAARKEADTMRSMAGTADEIQRAVLRMGDVERVAGNLDKAVEHYAESEERYRSRNKTGGIGGGITMSNQSQPKPVKPVKSPATPSAFDLLRRSEAWKIYMVHDAAQSSKLRAYVNQGAYDEAFAALAQWENETPFSKLGGDFTLAEARCLYALGDERRAVGVLLPFVRMDVMSSQLPEAANLAMFSLYTLKRYDEAEQLAKDSVKRFEGLPVAQRAANLLVAIEAEREKEKEKR